MKQAAKLVNLDKHIASLENGYDTLIIEQGSNLSHGQRQLICFARALASEPEIMILDEATASVDPISEQMIQNAVDKIFEEKTVIAIAHRLSTIEKCDNIFVIQKGELKESGNFTNLIEKNGIFAELAKSLT